MRSLEPSSQPLKMMSDRRIQIPVMSRRIWLPITLTGLPPRTLKKARWARLKKSSESRLTHQPGLGSSTAFLLELREVMSADVLRLVPGPAAFLLRANSQPWPTEREYFTAEPLHPGLCPHPANPLNLYSRLASSSFLGEKTSQNNSNILSKPPLPPLSKAPFFFLLALRRREKRFRGTHISTLETAEQHSIVNRLPVCKHSKQKVSHARKFGSIVSYLKLLGPDGIQILGRHHRA